MKVESLKKAGLAALAGIGGLALSAGGALAATKDPLNSGDTAWMITSSALVLMMTIPGQIGDGKIFVTPLEQVVRIRTGETDGDAL